LYALKSNEEFPFLIGRIRTFLFYLTTDFFEFPFLIGRIRTKGIFSTNGSNPNEVSIPHR